jgi:hypothetical protein
LETRSGDAITRGPRMDHAAILAIDFARWNRALLESI